MEKDLSRLYYLQRAKSCCTQAMAVLALELAGREDTLLEQASAALCMGIHRQEICGALTGGALMLGILLPQDELPGAVSSLTEWFSAFAEEEYGSMQCRDICGGDPLRMMTRCPALIEKTWLRVRELLEDVGLDVEGMMEGLPEEAFR